MHFDLDSHDAYAATDDDPSRLVPNPAKKKAHKQVLAARTGYERHWRPPTPRCWKRCPHHQGYPC
jgi:hypothetical protein